MKIAYRTFIYSSKDFIPNINFDITQDEVIEITNKSRKLYKIDCLNFLKIETIGFEDYKNNSIVKVPYISKSFIYNWIKNDVKTNKIIINSDFSGPCAYLCPYDKKIINGIKDKIFSEYSMESKKGYAAPYLQSHFYILEIVFLNQFFEKKSLIYIQEHLHGLGIYDKQKVNEEFLNKILNKSNIPRFKNTNEFWDYIFKKYSISNDSYFGS